MRLEPTDEIPENNRGYGVVKIQDEAARLIYRNGYGTSWIAENCP